MLSSSMIIEIPWAIMDKISKITKKTNKIIKGIMRKNAFECLILGKKLTCVKFSGAFDGIIENT